MLLQVLSDARRKAGLVPWGLKLVWAAGPAWTLGWVLILAIQGTVPVASAWLLRGILNDLASPAGGTYSGSGRLAFSLGAMAVLWLAGQVAASVLAWIRSALAERVRDAIHDRIHRQVNALDLAFFEQAASHDLLHRARTDAISQPLALLENTGILVQNGCALAGLALILGEYGGWMPVLLLGSALPGLAAIAAYTVNEHRWRVENTSNERRAMHLDWLLADRGAAAEFRLFDLGDYHRKAFRSIRARLREGRLRLARREMAVELLAGTLVWGGGILGVGWVLRQVLAGHARIGDLVFCYQAFLQGERLLRSILDGTGKLYRATLFLDDLCLFLSLSPAVADPGRPEPVPECPVSGIKFEAVTFRYPGAPAPSLREFSLDIPVGRITAIVGRNGAGKSTLIKLLCRLFDPEAGRVSLDGQDLRDFSLAELRRRITVLFQEPVHYQATAAENITMGYLPMREDSGRVRMAAEAAGAVEPLERLDHGLDTLLGKWFGGAELSTGEWQRLALARAYFRDGSIVVLDEPTSAMDVWTEADWMSRFRRMVEGRTALLVTHRFTTAMQADYIHVMEEGRVVESGTHEQLLASGGSYALAWNAQMVQA